MQIPAVRGQWEHRRALSSWEEALEEGVTSGDSIVGPPLACDNSFGLVLKLLRVLSFENKYKTEEEK